MNYTVFCRIFTILLALGISLEPPVLAQVTLNPFPARAFGQAKLLITTTAPNLVEGRELNSPQAVAVDTSTTPPGLYVSDTANNRVLGWKNGKAPNGSLADVVIGQRDASSTIPLGPGTTVPTGLSTPSGLAVDKNGNLYVVDSGNNRILRFPKPFQQTGDLIQPDLIIGQLSLTARNANLGDINNKATERSIWTSAPNAVLIGGLLFDAGGNLWFSDPGNNRVLRYPAASLTANAPSADLVLGQPDFSSKDPLGTGTVQTPPVQQRKTGLFQPAAMAMDSAGRLFVADAYSRVLVYEPPFRNGKDASRIAGWPRNPFKCHSHDLRIAPHRAEVQQFLGNRLTGRNHTFLQHTACIIIKHLTCDFGLAIDGRRIRADDASMPTQQLDHFQLPMAIGAVD